MHTRVKETYHCCSPCGAEHLNTCCERLQRCNLLAAHAKPKNNLTTENLQRAHNWEARNKSYSPLNQNCNHSVWSEQWIWSCWGQRLVTMEEEGLSGCNHWVDSRQSRLPFTHKRKTLWSGSFCLHYIAPIHITNNYSQVLHSSINYHLTISPAFGSSAPNKAGRSSNNMEVILLYYVQNKVGKRKTIFSHGHSDSNIYNNVKKNVILLHTKNCNLLTAKMYACVGGGHITVQRNTVRMHHWATTQDSPWKTILEVF